ncbi:MAG: cation:proton antiporter, partial [Blastocatellia bacterium]|nr:cation:proton antiporter [Blastocatellia bacterium]
MKKNLLFYSVLLLLSAACIYLALLTGAKLESRNANQPAQSSLHGQRANTAISATQPERASYKIGSALRENLRQPLAVLLLQVIVILIASRLISRLFSRIGQPSVIGEMVAGIILGPSLLGMFFPEAMSFIFPDSSLGTLRSLSQIGVILFMFIVGTDINAHHLRDKARAAVIISHTSIVVPFLLGIIVSQFIYNSFAPPRVSFISFALFMGVAMSITAFPVLARIIDERGMNSSYLGNMSIACAAVDDVTAWCILATVIAIAKMNGMGLSALTILLALAFTATMLYLVRPRLECLIGDGAGKNSGGVLAWALIIALLSAYITDAIGIHALFGAFLAGAVMPATSTVRSFLRDKIAAFSSTALLPLFFAFTGLRTQVALLNDWQGWLVCAGIIAVAIAGKLGGGMLAARWSGMSWSDAISIGVLMNTRGLMELVVLNIG